MAMQTMYWKEHEGNNGQNSIGIGQLSSTAPGSWWSPLGSQVYGLKTTELDSHSLDKGTTTQFSFIPGEGKTSGNAQKLPAALSLQSTLPEYRACFELGFGQPMVYAKHPYADQYYGLISTYGPQLSGRIMLPLDVTTDDGPIYVNAKQYHGILRRRKSRAKAVLENKLTKKRKPYMHFSRHLHAVRRPRGCGGRFLNTKNLKNGNMEDAKNGNQQLYHQLTGSQSSEVLQSESGTPNSSSKEATCNGSNISSSEVTSMYSREEFDFSIGHFKSSVVHSFSGIMDGGGHGIVLPPQWVAAADNCCDLKA